MTLISVWKRIKNPFACRTALGWCSTASHVGIHSTRFVHTAFLEQTSIDTGRAVRGGFPAKTRNGHVRIVHHFFRRSANRKNALGIEDILFSFCQKFPSGGSVVYLLLLRISIAIVPTLFWPLTNFAKLSTTLSREEHDIDVVLRFELCEQHELLRTPLRTRRKKNNTPPRMQDAISFSIMTNVNFFQLILGIPSYSIQIPFLSLFYRLSCQSSLLSSF